MLCDHNSRTLHETSQPGLEQRENSIVQLMNKNKFNSKTIVSIASFHDRFLVQNWILSLKRIRLDKFVVICGDSQMLSFINDIGYENSTVLVPHEWLLHPTEINNCDTWDQKFAESKASIWYHLLALNQSFIHSDPDTVWINNRIHIHLDNKLKRSYANILFALDSTSRILSYNTGFFCANATLFVKDLFARVLDEQKRTMQNLNRSKPQNSDFSDFNIIASNDIKTALNRVLLATKYNDSRTDSLDPLIYPNGMVFFSMKLNHNMKIRPLIVHANHLSSYEGKVNALKSADLWFVQTNQAKIRFVVLFEQKCGTWQILFYFFPTILNSCF
jgi:hypothetical protein